MINFCYSELSEINCNKPICDGHPAENLISRNQNRNNGFLADHFVKPPVDIKLKFVCDIDVKKIKLNCLVRSQKSKLINVISKTSGDLPSVVAKGSVNVDEKHLIFHFRGSPKDNEGKYETFYNTKSLYCVNEITIKILLTERSTAPALGGLEIWGYVSSRIPKSIRHSVFKTWNIIENTRKEDPIIPSPSCDFIEKKTLHNVIKKDISKLLVENSGDDEIPNEFIDPITCKIFTLPMILPSGNVVDFDTIEKFNKAEARWGRPPSDPFTGVHFTADKKPIVATLLKERLDLFYFKNCDKPILKNLPRSVGRSSSMNSVLLYENNPYLLPTNSTHITPKLEKRKHMNIDSLLEFTLSGLPSFLDEPVGKKQKIECMKCYKNEMLFKLACEHFVCRHCLVKMDKSRDHSCICNKQISFNEVIRFHVS